MTLSSILFRPISAWLLPIVAPFPALSILISDAPSGGGVSGVETRVGVKDTRLEAKDTKNIQGQGQPF